MQLLRDLYAYLKSLFVSFFFGPSGVKSYAIGGGTASMSLLVEHAQAATVFLGLAIVFMHFVHDGVMYWDKWKNRKRGQ